MAIIFILLLLLLFVVLRGQTQGLAHARQMLYHWATTPIFFLWDRISVGRPASNWGLQLPSAEIIGILVPGGHYFLNPDMRCNIEVMFHHLLIVGKFYNSTQFIVINYIFFNKALKETYHNANKHKTFEQQN
jgi:hypothetical protein